MAEADWLLSLKQYETGDIKKSIFQIITTFTLYFISLSLIFFLIIREYPYWLVILLSFPTAGFYTRIFIIGHDCGHNSYFSNQRVCRIIGTICGMITLTPYNNWRRSHAIHHATVSNLEKRGTGDVWTMTVEEYKSSSILIKLRYRIYRNPVFLFGIAPVLLFVFLYRLPHKKMKSKDLASILYLDLVLLIMFVLAYFTIGLSVFLKAVCPLVIISTSFGTWLFFIQHQFQNVYWSHSDDWNRIIAALKGSSFYKLPAVLRWFSGNIGYHHIHHLNPRIPNYNLKKCYEKIPEVRNVIPLTFAKSLKSLFLTLWDEDSSSLVSFKILKK